MALADLVKARLNSPASQAPAELASFDLQNMLYQGINIEYLFERLINAEEILVKNNLMK